MCAMAKMPRCCRERKALSKVLRKEKGEVVDFFFEVSEVSGAVVLFFGWRWVRFTLPKFNSSPLKISRNPNGNFIFQPPFFNGYVK